MNFCKTNQGKPLLKKSLTEELHFLCNECGKIRNRKISYYDKVSKEKLVTRMKCVYCQLLSVHITFFLKIAMLVASVTVNISGKNKKGINNQAAAPIKFDVILMKLNLFVSLLKRVREQLQLLHVS